MKSILLHTLFTVIFLGSFSSIAANFTLTILTNGSGMVSKNPTNATYPGGAVVTITAAPASDWFFSHWSGDASGSTNPLNVLINGNKSITAHFQLVPVYSLSTIITGEGTITMDPPGGNYARNTLVTLSANPAPHWIFQRWSGDVSSNTNTITLRMNSSKSIETIFVEPARIIQQPEDITVNFGSTAGFGVQSSGTGLLGYQWYFDNTPIPGANTRSHVITNIQASDLGSYRVVVTNSFGSETSNPARLFPNMPGTGQNTVTNCTEADLRWAIAQGGIINFMCNGKIIIANTILITNHVILDATNASVVLSGDNKVRLFRIQSGASLTAHHFVIANGFVLGTQGNDATAQSGGSAQGAAFLNEGQLVLSHCSLTNNQVKGGLPGVNTKNWGTGGAGQGGAVFNQGGFLTISNSHFANNFAIGSDARPLFGGEIETLAGAAFGGAIYSTAGNVIVLNTLLQSNIATGGWADDSFGGAVHLQGGTNNILNSQLLSNKVETRNNLKGTAQHCGGGAVYLGSGQLTLEKCIIQSNTALGGNGFRHSSGGQGNGGAIYSRGSLALLDCSIFQNLGLTGIGGQRNHGRGGAIYNSGTLAISSSSIFSNLVVGGQGGGGSQTFDPSGNGYGGGIFNSGNIKITNSTIALNIARGGGLNSNNPPGNAYGAGLFNTSDMVLQFTTIASNSLDSTAIALGANLANDQGSLSLRNSIVAYAGNYSNAWGAIIDLGFNISSDGSCQFNSGASFNFTDPRLQKLHDNGGHSPTMMPAPDSPAIDLASPIDAPSADQRNFPRPIGGGYDVGAVEFGSNPLGIVLTYNLQQAGLTINFVAQPDSTYFIQSSSNLLNWATIETIPSTQSNSNIARTIPVTQDYEFIRVRAQ